VRVIVSLPLATLKYQVRSLVIKLIHNYINWFLPALISFTQLLWTAPQHSFRCISIKWCEVYDITVTLIHHLRFIETYHWQQSNWEEQTGKHQPEQTPSSFVPQSRLRHQQPTKDTRYKAIPLLDPTLHLNESVLPDETSDYHLAPE